MDTERPIVTTLCGSSRFPDAFALANMHLSMLGRVVISLGCFGHADFPVGAQYLTSDGDETTPEKQELDQLHFRKIDISDGIFVVNPGGYIGSSTKREIAYAQSLGKSVEWLFPPADAPTPDRAAVKFSLTIDDHYDRLDFLRAWIEGDVSEWPEFRTFQSDGKVS